MRRDIARRLEQISDFTNPSVRLEQYLTPPEIAAHLIHLAALQGDLHDRPVVDLGAGTGMLALGASLAGATRVIGVEIDPEALGSARENESRMDGETNVDWIRGDATRPPLCLENATVITNPPFGAQKDSLNADRAFLGAAASIAAVSYSIHNAGSESFVESFAEGNGGTLTHAYRAAFEVSRQFHFHKEDERTLEVEVYRIEWSDGETSPP